MLYSILAILLCGVIYVAWTAVRTWRRISHSIEEQNKRDAAFDDIKNLRKALSESEVDLEPLGALKPWEQPCLQNFKPVQMGTHCLFAKKAKIWGCHEWDPNLSIEENAEQDILAFQVFTKAAKGLHLDGFLFEIPGEETGNSVELFGEAVRRLLCTVSSNDPEGVNCMKKSYIGKRGWWFEFDRESFFVTTFAPCYPSHHSRYAFGVKDRSFVLFQPEYSFAWHNIGDDTPDTNWDDPVTIRDKIRVEYRKNGRPYEIPSTIYYSPALYMVDPVNKGDPRIEWWIPLADRKLKQQQTS